MEITRHDPGSFCWAELATSDPKSAKAFYEPLFGWTATDSPMGPGPEDVYTMLRLGGADVGALYKMMKEQADQGIPPNWMVYIAVANADETVRKAKELGATVLSEPMDVMEHGRMAVLQDPTGAVFSIWQAKQHFGAKKVNEPGAASWIELNTRDAAKAEKFYGALFGWKVKHADYGAPYTEFSIGDQPPFAGLFTLTPEMEGVPPHWIVYWQVKDVDASAEKAKSLGGKVIVGPQDIPTVGRFALVQDPQGAPFSIIKIDREA